MRRAEAMDRAALLANKTATPQVVLLAGKRWLVVTWGHFQSIRRSAAYQFATVDAHAVVYAGVLATSGGTKGRRRGAKPKD